MHRLLCVALFASLSTTTIAADDISKVNGSISTQAGQAVGDLDTVNGSIHLAANASAEDLSSVNGAINIGDDAMLDSAETVNGRITVGARTRVKKSIEAVNGGISLAQGADVGGRVSNVNGTIRITAAHVGGGIGTVSGDIEIGADSRIEGGLLVEKSNSWFGSSKPVRVVIGPRAIVEGTLEFRRDVELLVSDSARIGTVKGATATIFKGDQP